MRRPELGAISLLTTTQQRALHTPAASKKVIVNFEFSKNPEESNSKGTKIANIHLAKTKTHEKLLPKKAETSATANVMSWTSETGEVKCYFLFNVVLTKGGQSKSTRYIYI